MFAVMGQWIWRAVQPGRLIGPIFDKELRVSSRRRRNYALRSAYLALLLMFVVLVWLAEVRYSGSVGYRVWRMAQAGKMVIMTITWFQFCTLQLIAVIMLSTSVSEEIYRRTLPALMTTPMGAVQIVAGKLAGKLLQLLILLAISVPLLAVVRVFGGVQWNFVVQGVCITLAAVLFAGSLSMFFSIHSRRSYAVILKTLITMGILYGLVPLLIFMSLEHKMRDKMLIGAMANFNPILAMAIPTEELMSPRRIGFFPWFSWKAHCLVMLGASGALLFACTVLLRRVALAQAAGEPAAGRWLQRLGRLFPRRLAGSGRRGVRRILGCPVLWRELRTPLTRNGATAILISLGALALLGITYGLCAAENALDDQDTHMAYILILLGLGVLVTAVVSATGITSEKEARSWPILLATPLGAGRIVLGKAAGVLRRCLPVWALLAFHTVLFVFVGYIRPIVPVHLAMLVAWLTVFLTGSGLYFGARFRRTTTAVAMNVGLVIGLWCVVPAMVALVAEISRDYEFPEWYAASHPAVQAVVVTEGASGKNRTRNSRHEVRYNWPDGQARSQAATTGRIAGQMLFHVAAGLFLMWRATRRVRAGDSAAS